MQSITVDNIVKKYKVKKTEVDALKGVSFSVDKGEIFGMIGPTGPVRLPCSVSLPPCCWQTAGRLPWMDSMLLKIINKYATGWGICPAGFHCTRIFGTGEPGIFCYNF